LPRLKDEAMDCVIYLYPTVSSAEKGVAAGGTGLLVAIPSKEMPDTGSYTYAITNSHVIKGPSPVIRLKGKEGGHVIVDTSVDDWVHHPAGDDVAACAINLPKTARFGWIKNHMWATKELVERHNIGPGDDVCMIGRFINHEGKEKNIPTVRFGNISMMPWEPIENSTGAMQDSYLIECRSLPGYSGSPVFVYESAIHLGSPRKERMPFLLLGIDWCHPANFQKVMERDGKTPVPGGWKVDTNSGMAGVIPAWKIQELLEGEPFVTQRRESEKRIAERKNSATVALDVAEPHDESFTKEDFENALKRASRRIQPSPPDEGKSGT